MHYIESEYASFYTHLNGAKYETHSARSSFATIKMHLLAVQPAIKCHSRKHQTYHSRHLKEWII